jgi:hypothetical protein
MLPGDPILEVDDGFTIQTAGTFAWLSGARKQSVSHKW